MTRNFSFKRVFILVTRTIPLTFSRNSLLFQVFFLVTGKKVLIIENYFLCHNFNFTQAKLHFVGKSAGILAKISYEI